MMFAMATPTHDNPIEALSGAVERVTFHSEETGFCVLRVKARGHRDLVTVVGTAAAITPGEFVSCEGWWVTDRTYGLQFKTASFRWCPPPVSKASKSTWARAWSKALARTLPKSSCAPLASRSLTSSNRRPSA